MEFLVFDTIHTFDGAQVGTAMGGGVLCVCVQNAPGHRLSEYVNKMMLKPLVKLKVNVFSQLTFWMGM